MKQIREDVESIALTLLNIEAHSLNSDEVPAEYELRVKFQGGTVVLEIGDLDPSMNSQEANVILGILERALINAQIFLSV